MLKIYFGEMKNSIYNTEVYFKNGAGMIGIYRIIIQSKKVRYDFVINRNITVITGDSATGKSTLVNMIRDFYRITYGRGR